jgi:H+/Cl- antiporter ClcA
MNINYKKKLKNINKKISKFKNLCAKNYLKFFFTLIFLSILTIATTFIIIFYCDIFFKFSNIAKDRILNRRETVFLITPLFFWVSSYLYKKFAFNPYGTGLDNITFAIKKLQKKPKNYFNVSNFIGIKIALIIFISSLFSTIGGGSLGREAPSIVIAVCIVFGLSYYFRKFLINLPLENWIYVGYAIGISVAFKAPIAGIFYVVEKLIKSKSKNYKISILFSLFALVIIYHLLLNNCSVYVIKNFKNLAYYDLFHYLVITLICSLMALFLLSVSRYLFINFIKIKKIYWHFIPIFFGIVVAFCGLKYGVYSIGGGILSVNEALISNTIIYDFDELIGRYFSTIFTYIAGNSGGLVAPSIALGNLVGNVYGSVFENLDAKALMLVGMVAFLSPVLSAPLTSTIIILESIKIDIANIDILAIISVISFSLVIIFKKIGAKIRAKLFKPTTN